MRHSFTLRSTARAAALLALAASLLLGCEEFVGIEPPDDALFFPIGVAIHPEGRYLYVVNSNFNVAYTAERGGTVAVVDADTLQVIPESTVRIGSFGGEALLSEDARYLYVSVRGDRSIVRLAVSEDGRELSCPGSDDALNCRFEDLFADPFAMALERVEGNLDVGGEAGIDLLTVTHLASNDLTAISYRDDDLATQVRVDNEITAGGSDIAIHPRTGEYYAVARFDDRVRIFRPLVGRLGEVVGIFSLGSILIENPVGIYDARSIAFSADGDRAYVATRLPHSVLVLDTSPTDAGGGARNQFIGQIDLEAFPESLVVVDEALGPAVYVTEFGDRAVTVVDPVNQIVVDRFLVGDGPTDIAVDMVRHQRMYVTLFGDNALAVIDLDPESRRYRMTVAKVR